MKIKNLCVWVLLGISANLARADEDTSSTPGDLEESENIENTYSSPENIPEPIGMPIKPFPKPHHHKQKETVNSHRSPVYEVVSQPCYSYGCRGGMEGGYQPYRGHRYPPFENRRPYAPGPEYYPDNGYYGSRDPEFGYGPGRGRPVYPQSSRYGGGYGEYSQPGYGGGRFLG